MEKDNKTLEGSNFEHKESYREAPGTNLVQMRKLFTKIAINMAKDRGDIGRQLGILDDVMSDIESDIRKQSEANWLWNKIEEMPEPKRTIEFDLARDFIENNETEVNDFFEQIENSDQPGVIYSGKLVQDELSALHLNTLLKLRGDTGGLNLIKQPKTSNSKSYNMAMIFKKNNNLEGDIE